jgi:hypothetical protein
MGKEEKSAKKKRKSAAAEEAVVATVPLKVESEAEGVTGALLACFADAPPPEEVTHGKGEISFECSRTPAGPCRTPSMQPTLTTALAFHHVPSDLEGPGS